MLSFASTSRGVVVVGVAAAMAAPAMAQWSVTNLTPSWASNSGVTAMSGGRQLGYATVGSTSVSAGLWSGSESSWVSLGPAGYDYARGFGMGGGQQVGDVRVTTSSATMASLWTGSAGSFVNLSPAGSAWSIAHGTSGTQQVGVVSFVPEFSGGHAALWSGSAESFVDLHAPWMGESRALKTDGSQQVGFSQTEFSDYRALLWSGTAASAVDLTPSGSSNAIAYDVYGGKQVGDAFIGGVQEAIIWSGSAESAVSLAPAGAQASTAVAIYGEFVVGSVMRPEETSYSAALWSGTAESYVDLSAFLEGSWDYATGTSVWSDGATVYVGGTGFNRATNRWEALLWTRPLCGTADFDGNGDSATDADIEAFFACLAGNCCGACFGGGSDFNGDGDFGTDADIESFFRVLAGGGC